MLFPYDAEKNMWKHVDTYGKHISVIFNKYGYKWYHNFNFFPKSKI